jgi:hypothetical protein
VFGKAFGGHFWVIGIGQSNDWICKSKGAMAGEVFWGKSKRDLPVKVVSSLGSILGKVCFLFKLGLCVQNLKIVY